MANNKPIADKISEKIASHQIKMKPKAYFITGSVLLGAGIAAGVMIAMFFVSIAVFRFRVHEPFDYLKMGRPGFMPFLHNFPWIPMLIAVVGIIAGLYLIKRFNIGYRQAFVGIVAGFIVAAVGFGLAIDASGLPERVQGSKPFKPFFQENYSGENWVVGMVEEIADDQLTITQPEGKTTIITIENTTIIKPRTEITNGEIIKVLGQQKNGEYFAEAVFHGSPPRGGPFPPHEKPGNVKGKQFCPSRRK
ncbi:hypothetical protein KKG41_02050 [Patescibacteria group bacterium]|nr:hypothetical protein [Patescibacteria group bacterium]MBU1890512.1 hypothetical protein [Patescibacteria group bacterium]